MVVFDLIILENKSIELRLAQQMQTEECIQFAQLFFEKKPIILFLK